MRVPIACTLGADGQAERSAEWRAFDREVVVERVRASRERLRLRLDDALPDAAARTVKLARREHACCGFFEFSLEIRSDATWLEIVVPTDASRILDEFALTSS